MNRIADFFNRYRAEAALQTELQDLNALRVAFESYNTEFPREKLFVNGPLPFADFNNWVARKVGKKKPGICGCWPRFDGSFWDLIAESHSDGEAGYKFFLSMYDEFRELTTTKLQIARSTKNNTSEGIRIVENWELTPNAGFIMTLVFQDGWQRYEGFFTTLDELKNYGQQQYGIQLSQWEEPTFEYRVSVV